RLVHPHAMIVEWMAERTRQRAAAKREHFPHLRELMDPGDYTALERRQLRILDALLKTLEKRGAAITAGEGTQVVAEINGETLKFRLREKHRQVRRPLDAEEKRLFG